MNSNRSVARTFGIFFLVGYAAYIAGNVLANSPQTLSYIYANKPQIIFGAILMSMVETFFNMGLVVIILPVLKKFNKTLTYGYFTAGIMSTLLMVVGAIFLFLLVPLSEEFVKAGTGAGRYFQTLSALYMKGNFFSYQTAMAIWGLGGLLFCYVLYISKLVPKFLSIWGFIGYIIFTAGSILALFGFSVDVIMDIPGGLFEITLAIWLIVKGFNPGAFALATGHVISNGGVAVERNL
jgi:hypothetical protein